jgi:mono/diheme cytochrome c family protein
MSRRGSNILLLVAFLISAGLNWALWSDRSRPHFEFLPEMVHAIAYDAFSPNPVLADGKTLQAPVEGTIPRGYLPLHYEATAGDALRAGEELISPLSPEDKPALERGTFLFTQFCQVCHGPQGTGDGPVAQRGYPPPASLLGPKALKMKDGQMFHVLTYGQGNMPSYASQISREERWKIILYVRSLQKKGAAPPPGGQP